MLLLFILSITLSIISGVISPFTTILVGQSFALFAANAIKPSSTLLHDIGIVSLQLFGLSIGSLALATLSSACWIRFGEHKIQEIRESVYKGVMTKEMAWFDAQEQGEGPGGLMAILSRDTQDIKASWLSVSSLISYATASIFALILAFFHQTVLTLLLLSSIPLLLIIQAIAAKITGPLLDTQRRHAAQLATAVGTTMSNISTIKGSNYSPTSLSLLNELFESVHSTTAKPLYVWGISTGLSQFITLAMFVQGFWFGASIVRSSSPNEVPGTAGDVMTTFWASLLVITNLQRSIPHLAVLGKGKASLENLRNLAGSDSSQSDDPSDHDSNSVNQSQTLEKRIRGEFTLHQVSFTYPSRPKNLALDSVSLFLPSSELTFIVGSSGSGKSTVGSLLVGLYPTSKVSGDGHIRLDDRPIGKAETIWIAKNVSFVSAPYLTFDGTLLENITLSCPRATLCEVEAASRLTLLYDFVTSLPNGYSTHLGNGGIALSGGQKQRMALTRAILQNPEVLILDEPISALDPINRSLVFEAIRAHRSRTKKTTIVITHDLSSILPNDFVYVLRDGRVAQQGYRKDLEETDPEGKFVEMVKSSGTIKDDVGKRPPVKTRSRKSVKSGDKEISHSCSGSVSQSERRQIGSEPGRPLPMLPSRISRKLDPLYRQHVLLQATATQAAHRRQRSSGIKRRTWDGPEDRRQPVQVVEGLRPPSLTALQIASDWTFAQYIYSSIPNKVFLILGILLCVLAGAITPIFAFFLSRLVYEVSVVSVTSTNAINTYGSIVLILAAVDGILSCGKFIVMEVAALQWLTHLRFLSAGRILAQDQSWFDRESNSPAKIIQALVNDGDDARSLISSVLGQCAVVVTMLTLGIVWAMILGWQLTLIGLGLAPLFAGVMIWLAQAIDRCEARNRRAAESVSKKFYDSVSQVRAIRALSCQDIFQSRFSVEVAAATSSGLRGSWLQGSTFGFAIALIYIAEAVLFVFGAYLVTQRIYSYLQMVQVLNLLVFSLTISSQLISFTNRISGALQASRDFMNFVHLEIEQTRESRGTSHPHFSGSLTFRDVSFSYPERPKVMALEGLSLRIQEGERVAIVGSSGSGKSTFAALLQRLYEPSSGSITIGGNSTAAMDIRHLRAHVALVSQNPHLFDMSVTDNILFGDQNLTDDHVQTAARAAQAHDFILNLPQGYSTVLGNGAALLSGGQAQRIQIARALSRPSHILVFDEATSALDPVSQSEILETLRSATRGRTTIMITHQLPVMRMCDRIICLHAGKVVEQGTYDDLMNIRGIFFGLANAGEWLGH